MLHGSNTLVIRMFDSHGNGMSNRRKEISMNEYAVALKKKMISKRRREAHMIVSISLWHKESSLHEPIKRRFLLAQVSELWTSKTRVWGSYGVNLSRVFLRGLCAYYVRLIPGLSFTRKRFTCEQLSLLKTVCERFVWCEALPAASHSWVNFLHSSSKPFHMKTQTKERLNIRFSVLRPSALEDKQIRKWKKNRRKLIFCLKTQQTRRKKTWQKHEWL